MPLEPTAYTTGDLSVAVVEADDAAGVDDRAAADDDEEEAGVVDGCAS